MIKIVQVVHVVDKERIKMKIKNLISLLRTPTNQNSYLKKSKENQEIKLMKVKFPSLEKCIWINSEIDMRYDVCDT